MGLFVIKLLFFWKVWICEVYSPYIAENGQTEIYMKTHNICKQKIRKNRKIDDKWTSQENKCYNVNTAIYRDV